jgi:hypothetical protein
VSDVVAPASATKYRTGDEAMTNEKTAPTTHLEVAIEWSLARRVDDTRESIIKRARSLAERLTRMADGLEQDPDYTVNSLGELQGNGVELDAMCMKLSFARETLRHLRQATAADAKKEAAS